MIANEDLSVASQEAANALINSRNSIFIEALSTSTLHGGKFVLLKNGNVGQSLLDQHCMGQTNYLPNLAPCANCVLVFISK